MNYIKLFESYNDDYIEEICDKYGIENYTIRDDGETIDVDGNVDISFKDITRIPLIFGKVNGYFSCGDNYQLKSLEGCPDYVGGMFDCTHTPLSSLKGGPSRVDGDFNCYHSPRSLEGGPSYVGGDFICYSNGLTTLKGSPNYVGGTFVAYNNKLKTLKYITKDCTNYSLKNNPAFELLDITPKSFSASWYLNKIIDLQDEFMIWNSNDTLNKHNFQELMIEIENIAQNRLKEIARQ